MKSSRPLLLFSDDAPEVQDGLQLACGTVALTYVAVAARLR